MDDPKVLAAEKKAEALAARISAQTARSLAKIGQIKAQRGGPSALTAFAAGFKMFAGTGPKQSIRAKTPEGCVAFHFSLTTISRASELTAKISEKPSRAAADGDGQAGAHQRYIERDDAVENDKTKERDVASEKMIGPERDGYAAAAATYIDRDEAVEIDDELDDQMSQSVRSSFGNIGETVAERIAFWDAVERAERRPLNHQVKFDLAFDGPFWTKVAADPEAPAILKKMAAKDSGVYVITLNNKDAEAAYDYHRRHHIPGSGQKGVPSAVTCKPGRGGRVQYRLVCELPADMKPQQRLEIARRFCEQFDAAGLRYHCAVHAPNSKNHVLNHHMHITYHDRPAAKVIHPGTGEEVWDFEVIENFRDSKRTARSRRPLMQDKDREFQSYRWPKTARAHFAKTVNQVRAQYGMSPLYDPRSYKEMDIGVEAVPSLNRKEYNDLRKGQVNRDAEAKMQKRWDRLVAITAQDVETVTYDNTIMGRLKFLQKSVARIAPASLPQIKMTQGEYILARKAIASARADRAALDLAIEQHTIGMSTPQAKKFTRSKEKAGYDKRAREAFRRELAAPLYQAEGLAVRREIAATARIDELERLLKQVGPGSKSLPSRPLETLAANAGLTAYHEAMKAKEAIWDPTPVRPQPAKMQPVNAQPPVLQAKPKVEPVAPTTPSSQERPVEVPPPQPAVKEPDRLEAMLREGRILRANLETAEAYRRRDAELAAQKRAESKPLAPKPTAQPQSVLPKTSSDTPLSIHRPEEANLTNKGPAKPAHDAAIAEPKVTAAPSSKPPALSQRDQGPIHHVARQAPQAPATEKDEPRIGDLPRPSMAANEEERLARRQALGDAIEDLRKKDKRRAAMIKNRPQNTPGR